MWLPFIKVYLATFCAGLVAFLGFILIVDPYDSGRFGVAWTSGVADEDPRTADVSRGRDPRFDSAVIGNSHGQLLDPARLSAASGMHFVQLTVPGTGPREQLTLLRWFARHHTSIAAIVLAADSSWCTQDPSLPISNEFPFWLYADGDAEYVVNVLRTAALDRGWRRILLGLGLRRPSDPAGYWDYESGHVWAFAPTVPDGISPASKMREPRGSFPAIERLRTVVSGLARDVRFAVVFPPVFVTELPKAGSAEAELMAECKGAFAQFAAGRGAFLDFAVDGERARDPRNFMDATHYRSGLAREMESRIAAKLAEPRH